MSMICPRSAAGSVTMMIVFSFPLDRTRYLRVSPEFSVPVDVIVTATSKLSRGKRTSSAFSRIDLASASSSALPEGAWASAPTGETIAQMTPLAARSITGTIRFR